MASSIEICGICEARNISIFAVEYCPDCEDRLCKGCLEHHSISKATRYHSTISMENYKELPKFIRDIKQQCAEHNEIYQNYCINHDIPLCKRCVVTTHKHCKDTTTLDAMTQNAKSSVAVDVIESKIADVHLNVQNILQDRKENLSLVIEKEKSIQREISDDRVVINRLFDKLEQQMKLELDTIKSRLENVIEHFETKNIKLKQTRDSIGQIKMYASEFQVFLGMKEIENQVQIDEKNIDLMLTDGSLNVIDLQYHKMEIEPGEFGRISTEENPPSITVVRRDVKQAQESTQNKIPCIQISNQENSGSYWVQYSYNAKDKDELTIDKDEIITILDDSDPDWWRVRKYDSRKEISLEGLVPAKYLTQDELYHYAWYFGPASKTERNKIVLANGKVSGSFMVTESTGGEYFLSVLKHSDSDVVVNYLLTHDTGYGISVDESYYCDLPEMIDNCSDSLQLNEPLGIAIAKNLEISKESVEIKELLHFGQFRDIWQGTLNKSKQVAVAAFKTGPRSKIVFASEIIVLRQCRHDRIIKLYGVCSCNELIYMITELAAKGNLLNDLRTSEGQKWKLPYIVEIASQIADGMSYLETKKYVHKYLAAKHILLVDDKNIKITDFQLTIQDDCYLADIEKKYVKWIAPEAALLGHFSTKSDVWSFGIVLVELISHGQVPYTDVKNKKVIDMIRFTGYRHPKPKNCSEQMYEIMMNCWKTDPKERPTFEYLFSVFDDYFVSVEPYYEEIDEDMLS